MHKKKSARKGKKNAASGKKRTPPRKRERGRKPPRKRKPARSESRVIGAAVIERFEVEVTGAAENVPPADETEGISEKDSDDDLPHDIGGSE